MTTYVPISDAVHQLHISNTDLLELVHTGRIKSAMESTGGLLVNTEDVKAIPKQERPEFKKYAHLVGVKITITGASSKYNIPHPTISRWMKKGYISRLDIAGRKTLVDEADVAYCASIYHANPGQGKWLFTDDGAPYSKKNNCE